MFHVWLLVVFFKEKRKKRLLGLLRVDSTYLNLLSSHPNFIMYSLDPGHLNLAVVTFFLLLFKVSISQFFKFKLTTQFPHLLKTFLNLKFFSAGASSRTLKEL